jgi:hypothetical protein
MDNLSADKIHTIVSEAIVCQLGNIEALPKSAQVKITSIYKVFFTAYLDIFRMKSRHEEVKYESIENLDAEVLQYMQHFFSDYQHIFRQFNVLNRKVRAILAIDQDRYPEEYQAHLKSLLSDNHDFNDESILKKIIELPWTNH